VNINVSIDQFIDAINSAVEASKHAKWTHEQKVSFHARMQKLIDEETKLPPYKTEPHHNV
jgi:FixJ family two-component response regulator